MHTRLLRVRHAPVKPIGNIASSCCFSSEIGACLSGDHGLHYALWRGVNARTTPATLATTATSARKTTQQEQQPQQRHERFHVKSAKGSSEKATSATYSEGQREQKQPPGTLIEFLYRNTLTSSQHSNDSTEFSQSSQSSTTPWGDKRFAMSAALPAALRRTTATWRGPITRHATIRNRHDSITTRHTAFTKRH